MNLMLHPFRRAARGPVPVWIVLGLVVAPAASAQWAIEPIGASEGIRELHDLGFDAQGRGLLSWDADLPGHVPPVFGGLAARDPAGGWQRPPDLAGVDPVTTQIHMWSQQRALLVAREGSPAGPGRRRLVVADGQSDGGFGALRTLAQFTAVSWSASNFSGDAIIAYTRERSPFIAVSERQDGHGFGPPRDMAIGRSATVAINARGDRLLAWPEGRRIGVRVRRAGGRWGRIRYVGRLPLDRDRRLSALVTDSGQMLITWGRDRGHCGVAVGGRGGWHARTLEQRCGPAAVGAREAPVLPLADSKGATYVAWTHATRRANSVTLARVGRNGPVSRSVVSRQRGAMLDDVAAGPGGAIAVTWAAVLSKDNPLLTATYAGVRRSGAVFDVQRLSPAGAVVARGSRVAFHPLTGQAVVAIPFVVGRTLAVGSAISPWAAPLPGCPTCCTHRSTSSRRSCAAAS
jgi:hypothetical protein